MLIIDTLRDFYGFSNADYVAHANNDNERHKILSEALPVGVLRETGCDRNGSNATRTFI